MTGKAWMWIVGGVAIFCVLAFLGMVGAGMYMMARHLQVQTTTPASADRQFEDLRRRFAGQEPLIRGRDFKDRARLDTSRKRAGGSVQMLHVLAYDPDKDKLVHLTLPFWLLRLKSHGMLQLSSDDFEFGDLELTVQDLEDYGPGLLLDRQERGRRVLVWSE